MEPKIGIVLGATRGKRTGSLPEGVLINAANPGVTLTDGTRDFMGTVFKADEAQTPAEAPAPILSRATMPPGTVAPYGELVERMQVIPFADTPL